MISLHILFFIFIILFAIIGTMRGWAKELLVLFSTVLALFFMRILESYVPFFKEIIATSMPSTVFLIRTGVLTAMVFFGYQTPKIQRLADSGRFARNILQDSLLGGFLGAVNGYFIFGTIWYYLNATGYPFSFVTAPDANTLNGMASLNLIHFLPPSYLMGSPAIYFAVAICCVFIVVVFI